MPRLEPVTSTDFPEGPLSFGRALTAPPLFFVRSSFRLIQRSLHSVGETRRRYQLQDPCFALDRDLHGLRTPDPAPGP